MTQNRFTLEQVPNFLETARRDGWEVKSETSNIGRYTIHNCTRSEPTYLGGSYQVLIVVVHTRPGYRASVKVSTTRRSNGRPYWVRGRTCNGAWNAWYAIRDIRAAWDHHNEREAKGQNTLGN